MDRPFRILLVGVAHDQPAMRPALVEGNGESPGVQALELDPLVLLDTDFDLPPSIDVAIFGSRLDKPLALADRLRRRSPFTQIIFLVVRSDLERFTAGLPFVPSLSEATTVEADARPDDLTALILEAALTARRREGYQSLQDRINQQLSSIAVLSKAHQRKRPTISEQDIAAILKRTDDPVLVLDLSGAMLAWNDEASDLFGIIRDDVDRLASDLFDPPVRDAFAALLVRAQSGETITDVETMIIAGSGETVPAQLSLAPVRDDAGDVAGIAATVHDLTDRKRQEAFEATMRGAGDLGAVAQALSRICESLVSVADKVSAGNGSMPEYLLTATEATRSAAMMAHRLHQFSQRQLSRPRLVNANEQLAAMEELIRRTVTDSIEVVIEPAPDIWPVRCNGDVLETALLNLVNNARDAMPEGGRMTIQTLNVSAEHEPARDGRPAVMRDYVVISVADTGTGMSPQVTARAFEPFFTTKTDRARGLGLTQVSRFARQADGDVRIESEPGRGTSVQLVLPRDGITLSDDLPS